MGNAGTLTEAGTVLGTASYISPEQAGGLPAGAGERRLLVRRDPLPNAHRPAAVRRDERDGGRAHASRRPAADRRRLPPGRPCDSRLCRRRRSRRIRPPVPPTARLCSASFRGAEADATMVVAPATPRDGSNAGDAAGRPAGPTAAALAAADRTRRGRAARRRRGARARAQRGRLRRGRTASAAGPEPADGRDPRADDERATTDRPATTTATTTAATTTAQTTGPQATTGPTTTAQATTAPTTTAGDVSDNDGCAAHDDGHAPDDDSTGHHRHDNDDDRHHLPSPARRQPAREGALLRDVRPRASTQRECDRCPPRDRRRDRRATGVNSRARRTRHAQRPRRRDQATHASAP